MGTEKSIMENINREGIVHSVDPTSGTVRVIFPDKEGTDGKPLAYGPLRVLTFGSKGSKYFWLPKVGDQGACSFLTNSTNGNNVGWVMGTFYSDEDLPPADAVADKRIIEHDGDLEIRCSGAVIIQGKSVFINK